AVKTFNITCTNSGVNSSPASAQVTVTLPDLITQNLTKSLLSPVAGDSVTFSGNVRNQGNAGTGLSFNSRFCIDNASCLTSTTGRVDGDITQAALAANTSSASVTSSTWTATQGSHTIYFCADTGSTSAGSITESDNTNNCTFTTFTVPAVGSIALNTTPSCTIGPPPAPKVDLSWNTISGGSPYSVFRNTSSYVTGLTTGSYADTSITPSTSYGYYIAPTAGSNSNTVTTTAMVCDPLTVAGPPCINTGHSGSDVTISWDITKNPGVDWVDIDNDSYFDGVGGDSIFYHKSASDSTCTTSGNIKTCTGPDGFGKVPGPGSLTLNPGTYYIRTYNSASLQHSPTYTYTIPACSSAAPTVSLSATSPIVSGSPTTLSWTITGTATSCSVSNSGTPTITSGDWTTTLTGSDVTSSTHTRGITMTTSTSGAIKTFNITCTNSGVNSSPASASVTVNTSSGPVCGDGVCNGTETNATCPGDCPISSGSCAWIQTFGGDVHSNTKIDTRCGP
ncbi:hypothetical protein HY008_03235, partial [Candidatus Woesebacteria bacterium]|nr:hypothetical protein [Candidatus Woesebacteria bacterium]